jgi:hypothetical protein
MTTQDGLFIYPDGSCMRGCFVNGIMEGQGKYSNRNFSYEGDWADGQPSGRGVEHYPDGSYYEGLFVKGKKEAANGKYRWANGKIYEGTFKDGYMEGQGRLTMEGKKGFC